MPKNFDELKAPIDADPQRRARVDAYKREMTPGEHMDAYIAAVDLERLAEENTHFRAALARIEELHVHNKACLIDPERMCEGTIAYQALTRPDRVEINESPNRRT